ncbi:MAG: hypothetical protein R3Y62_00640 [Eubacteriales bacterium]
MISKKLAFSVIVILGVFSAYLVYTTQPDIFNFNGFTTSNTTYDYDSFFLRFKEGTVNILAEDGHLAYVGNVGSGACNGSGKLYRDDGSLLYNGAFVNSTFEGNGSMYYKSGSTQYDGVFAENLYHGEGIYYWENGSKQYMGQWQFGMKSGDGVLYNSSGSQVFAGKFSADQLVYSQMAQQTTADIAEMYSGNTEIFVDSDTYCVKMPEIDAIYAANEDVTSLDNTRTVNSIYVLKDNFVVGDQVYTSISQIEELLGEPIYEGLTYADMSDQIAILDLISAGNPNFVSPDITVSYAYDNAANVTSQSLNYQVFVYAFQYEGLLYRFYCSKEGDQFAMYCIE